ncbi:head GIN domain-containing protein [Parvicella tangerina]|uniref:Putative auto-transporter adhesin head GIN domain-containing protein n=1 Tax=Parvicella tangerina TaxID=2829795 RepID=A0A916NES2_9FLAO|nr:head GIN domain-containing protein [Parvicella tangerina]CAG5076887.1 hypothetical protein CRYO30217_00233 [Parvicella tangerina]
MKKIALVALVGMTLTSCHDLIDGTAGAVTTEMRTEPAFHSINMEGNVDVFVSYDTINSIKIEAGENLIDYIETSVIGDELFVYEAPNNIVNTKPIRVYVTMDSLESVHMEGSGDLDVNDMSSDHLNVLSIGSGDANFEIDANNINYENTGSGDARFTGTVNSLNVFLEGSGDFKGKYMYAFDANVEIEGSGDALVRASNSLVATISGSGDITYYGNPTTVTTSVTGSGDVYGN